MFAEACDYLPLKTKTISNNSVHVASDNSQPAPATERRSGTFISLPLHPQKWQRINIMVTSMAVDMGEVSSMEEAIAQVSGSSKNHMSNSLHFYMTEWTVCNLSDV
jgi:hypothetical protein